MTAAAPSSYRARVHAPEFFNPPVLLAIGLFVANNFWLKFAFPGWLTGKLSDFLFCFFFPLYCSALIGLFSTLSARVRTHVGALLAIMSFVAMKTMPSVSDQVNSVFSYLSGLIGMGASRNVVDTTDLIVLPVVAVAVVFGRRQTARRELKAN